MRVYFDKTLPMFLSSTPSFDAYPVDVDENTVNIMDALGDLLAAVALEADIAGAPEDSSQGLATQLEQGLRKIVGDTYDQGADINTRTPNTSASLTPEGVEVGNVLREEV